MIEMGISIAAFVGIFIAGLDAVRNGLFRSVARLLITAFALLCALRFWYLATEWLSESLAVAPEQLAFAVFWGLFALLTMPLLAGMKALNQDFVPVYPVPLDRFFSFVSGAATGALLAAALLLSVMLNVPQFYPALNETRLLLPLHRMPDIFYRPLEKKLADLSDPKSRTPLPTSDRPTEDAPLQVAWK